MTTPLILSLTAMALAPPAPASMVMGQPVADAAPTLQARLDRLVERLEARRQAHHVPGMGFALVLDDQVVLARGFGLADVEQNKVATQQTSFAVGSTTKAFTATLIAMLVDEGRMSWDDPVREHLAEFRLTDPEADAQVVMRDLLCHRIGFASMGLLWYGNDATSQEILNTAVKAELLYPFREQWNYSNISYLAAGMAVGRTAGSDWHTLVRERIFVPLGMTGANTSLEAAQADPGMANGYRWDAREQALVYQPMRDVGPVAGAGAINASARDMAQWVRLQLGHGLLGDRRLVSESQHAETWKPHIEIGGGMDYGLGWFLREWNDRDVIDHAGGIDGFTAEVAMVPEDNLGFVLLMNLFASPLQEESRQIVFETMLGDWQPPDPAAPAEDRQPYLGTYIGNFAHFKAAHFKVVELNGNLAIDVPGQIVFELAPPDEQGVRQFLLTDQIKLRFNREASGDVESLTLFQAGFEFVLPREGLEPKVTGADALTPGAGDVAGVEGSDDASDLPDGSVVMAQVLEARGSSAATGMARLLVEGRIRFVHVGLEGSFTIDAEAEGGFVEMVDLGRFGTVRTTLADGRAGIESRMITEDDIGPEYMEQLLAQHPFTWLRDWNLVFEHIEVTGREEHEGEPVLVIELRPPLGAAHKLHVSELTHLPVAHSVQLKTVIGQVVPTRYSFDDWREVNGVMMPFHTDIENAFSGRMEMQIDRVVME